MLLFLFQARRRERDRDSRLGPEGRFTFSVRKHLYRRLMATAKDVDVSSPRRRVAAIGSSKERRRDPLFFLKKRPSLPSFSSPRSTNGIQNENGALTKEAMSLPDSPEILESMRSLLRFMRAGKEPLSADASISMRKTGEQKNRAAESASSLRGCHFVLQIGRRNANY